MKHLLIELNTSKASICGKDHGKQVLFNHFSQSLTRLAQIDHPNVRFSISGDNTYTGSCAYEERRSVNFEILNSAIRLIENDTRAFYRQQYRPLASRSGGSGFMRGYRHEAVSYNTIDGINPDISSDPKRLRRGVSAFIEAYSQAHLEPGKKCPITADMVILQSQLQHFPIDLMLAQFAMEGMGCNGDRLQHTKNPGNFGNDDAGNNRMCKTWEEGIALYCKGMKESGFRFPFESTQDVLGRMLKGHYGEYCPIKNNVYGRVEIPGLVKQARSIINRTP